LPAIHEAGHALVAALDGPRGTIPVYVSARPRNDHAGIVVPPYDGVAEGEEHTYADRVHRIRVGLAGRAAEQLVLGADQVSATGARSDLLRVYSLACELFVANGHSPERSSEAAVASNLAILHGQVAEADLARAEALCRGFLQTQYLAVLALLRQQRAVLDRLIAALMARGVLFQEDVRQLLQPET
jgi:ATP-dependent Zn protease